MKIAQSVAFANSVILSQALLSFGLGEWEVMVKEIWPSQACSNTAFTHSTVVLSLSQMSGYAPRHNYWWSAEKEQSTKKQTAKNFRMNIHKM